MGLRARPTHGLEHWIPEPQSGCVRGGGRASQVPGGPLGARAPLLDPGGSPVSDHLRHSGAAFRLTKGVGTRDENMSGLSHAAHALAVYASQRGSPRRHARLASGCWSALPGGARYPQGPSDRFQISDIPLSQAWPGARRVDPGSCPPGSPTDPDVRDSRIRLFRRQIRYGLRARCGMRAGGRAYRSISCSHREKEMYALCDRRHSHLRQMRSTR